MMGMPNAIFVRSLTAVERAALEAETRAAESFVMRRRQIILASARGQTATQIAQRLSCHDQCV